MSSGALDANRVEPKKEEGEQEAPHVPPAEPAEPTEQKGVKRKAGDMDGADATAAPRTVGAWHAACAGNVSGNLRPVRPVAIS